MNDTNPSLAERLTTLRDSIDRRIDELVEHDMPIDSSDAVTSQLSENAQCAARAVAAQARSSSQGGKRLRALLTIAAAGSQEDVLDLACAIEIFQTGALVHDDIIDVSDLRRGIPSAWKGLEDAYESIAHPSSSAEGLNPAPQPLRIEDTAAAHAQGTGLALMLGDMLATLSVRVAATSSSRYPNAAEFMATFLQMQHEVEVGQVLDLADDLISLADPETILRNCEVVYAKKTSSYTTIAPLQLGFLAAGLPYDQAREWADRIGRPLGLAFQIADDLADIIPSGKPTGKPLYGDIRSGKRSILLADTLSSATAAQARTLARIYNAQSHSDDDIAEVVSIFAQTGAIARSHQRIRMLWSEAEKAIREFSRTADITPACDAPLMDVASLFVPSDDLHA